MAPPVSRLRGVGVAEGFPVRACVLALAHQPHPILLCSLHLHECRLPCPLYSAGWRLEYSRVWQAAHLAATSYHLVYPALFLRRNAGTLPQMCPLVG